VSGLGKTAGGPVGQMVSNLGEGTGNLVSGITTGLGDGVTKLGQADVLGSLGSIGGGLQQGVGGLASGIAGYGRNGKTNPESDNTIFGVDLGENVGKLKRWGLGEEKKLEEEEEK
jgi:hypothetical protein